MPLTARKTRPKKEVALSDDLEQLAASIRHYRHERGLSQIGLAHLVGVSNKQLDNVEAARNWPSMPVYLTLCKVLCQPTPPLIGPPPTPL